MRKKLLSVLLSILMIIGTVSCLFTAPTFTASAESETENLMANISPTDWTSGWNGSTGLWVNDGIAVKAAWRSVYTKVTLAANTNYALSFNFGQVRVGDVRVYAASEITDSETQLVSVGSAPAAGGTNNIASETITSNCPTTPVDGALYTASEKFKSAQAGEYYIILDCYQQAKSSAVILKDLSLETYIPDPNVLANATASDWGAGWTGKTPAMDGEDISIGAAWHSVYIKATLEPSTEYTFSLNHRMVAVSDIRVYAATEITDASTQLTGSSAVAGGTNDLATGVKKYDATLSENALPDSTKYYNVSETFTTGTATEYYIIIDCSAGVTDNNIRIKSATLSVKEHDPNVDIVDPANWTTTASNPSVVAATESCSGGAGITVSPANWRDSYAKITLEANTAYDLSFAYMGGPISNFVIIAAKDFDATAFASNSSHVCNKLISGATACLSQSMSSYTFSTEAWTKISVSFTTNDDSSYYLILDHGANTTGFTASDFNFAVKKADPNTDIADPANWKSTRNGVNFAAATESKSGGKGITTGDNPSWVDTYAKVNLEANTSYTLSFAYKGATVISNMYILAVSDSTYSSGYHICNQLATNASYCLSQSMSGYTYSADAWTDITVTFTTNDATEYYVIFDHGDYTTGFTASDFSFVAEESSGNGESDGNILENTVAGDWVSTWDMSVGYASTAMAVKSAWRSAYTKLTLAPNTTYDFSAKASTVKINDIRVYAASEITDVESQLKNASTHVTGGTNDLALGEFTSTASSDNYAEADETLVSSYYTVSESFKTTSETEYYLIFDCSQYLDNKADYCTFVHLKELSLTARAKTPLELAIENAKAGFTGTNVASIRAATTELKQGLRVKSTVNTSLLTADDNGYKVVEYGTLVTKASLLNEGELTYELLNSDEFVVKKGVAYNEKDGTNVIYDKDDTAGTVTYTACLINIDPSLYGNDYVFRGYMILEDAEGNTTVVYDDQVDLSVFEVVKLIMDTSTSDTDIAAARAVIDANKVAYDAWVLEN